MGHHETRVHEQKRTDAARGGGPTGPEQDRAVAVHAPGERERCAVGDVAHGGTVPGDAAYPRGFWAQRGGGEREEGAAEKTVPGRQVARQARVQGQALEESAQGGHDGGVREVEGEDDRRQGPREGGQVSDADVRGRCRRGRHRRRVPHHHRHHAAVQGVPGDAEAQGQQAEGDLGQGGGEAQEVAGHERAENRAHGQGLERKGGGSGSQTRRKRLFGPQLPASARDALLHDGRRATRGAGCELHHVRS